ncbi:MAG: plasmid pRiA4b ORF-3 family protein [Pontimonas sp.]
MFGDYWSWRGPQWMARLAVSLDDVAAPIERTIEVDATLSAFDLHAVLQVAFGWNDSHLHEFRPGSALRPVEWQGDSHVVELVVTDTYDLERDYGWWIEALDEHEVSIGQLLAIGRSSAEYAYDFGDNWRHSIHMVEAFEPSREMPRARIVHAFGASPLDDVGSTPGLQELHQALAEPDNPNHSDAWDEVRFRFTEHSIGYDVAAKKLVTGALDTSELNGPLLRQFGLMIPAFGD